MSTPRSSGPVAFQLRGRRAAAHNRNATAVRSHRPDGTTSTVGFDQSDQEAGSAGSGRRVLLWRARALGGHLAGRAGHAADGTGTGRARPVARPRSDMPATARLVRGETDMEVPLDQVKVGDTVRVLPGEKIPLDGEIIQGSSNIDQSMISGKRPGGKRARGQGHPAHGEPAWRFLLKVEKVGQDTVLDQIVHMVGQCITAVAFRSRGWRTKSRALFPLGYSDFLADAGRVGLDRPTGTWPAYGIANAVAVLIIACHAALGLGNTDVHHGRSRGSGHRRGFFSETRKRSSPYRNRRLRGR